MMEKPTRKIFLDVGAHIGQTLQEAIKDDYLFDAIHCFEPMVAPFARLSTRFARQVEKEGKPLVFLHNFGLADFDGEKEKCRKNIDSSVFCHLYFPLRGNLNEGGEYDE